MRTISSLLLILVCPIIVSCPERKAPAPVKKDSRAATPGYSWKSTEARSHFDKAQQLIKKGQQVKAAKELRHAIVGDPKAPGPREALCRLLASGTEVERALDSCKAAVRVAPENIEMISLTARLQLRKRDFRAGLQVLEPALKLPIRDKVKKGRLLSLAGVMSLQVGNTKEAIDRLQEATRVDSKSRSAFRNLAIALAQGGRCDEARTAGDKARALKDRGHAVAGAFRHYCEMMLRAEVDGKAFLIDKRVVSGGEYASCVDVRACPKVSTDAQHRKQRAKPARSIHWEAAKAYCTKLNKRLPTLAEYKAAWSKLQRQGPPNEWTGDAGKKPQTAVQVRRVKKRLKVLETNKATGKRSTVRCAKDI